MTFLNQAERNYFVRKAGGASPQKPLNQIKREYLISQTGAAVSSIRLDELETRWLRKVVTDDGQTPDENKSALWRQAVVAAGGTPSNSINDNKLKFYLNAP